MFVVYSTQHTNEHAKVRNKFRLAKHFFEKLL